MPDFETVLPFFSSLPGRLLSGGVAPRHVKRIIAELQDHYTDLYDEGMKHGLSQQDANAEALARIGKEDDLVAEVLSKQELRSWTSRWPKAIYGIGPVVTAITVFFASLLPFVLLLVEEEERKLYLPPVWMQSLIEAGFFAVVYILPLIIAATVCHQASLRRDTLVWPIVGLVVLCIVYSPVHIEVIWPTLPDVSGNLSASFGLPNTVNALVRIFVNLGFVALFMTWCRTKWSRYIPSLKGSKPY